MNSAQQAWTFDVAGEVQRLLKFFAEEARVRGGERSAPLLEKPASLFQTIDRISQVKP